MMRIRNILLLFIFPIWAIAQNKPDVLEQKINKALLAFNIPGVAVSVVKDGKVLLARGFGVKEKGKPDAVTENTFFGIASNSKSFTAVALALLVEDGKLSWDDPVTKHLPWFRLSDPYITANIRIKDIISHNTGLASGAGELMIFPPSVYSAREILQRMKDVPVKYGLRERYAYNNTMFVLAGVLVEEVSGMKWEDFVQTRIFNKIGMLASSPKVSDLAKKVNALTPHLRINGNTVPAIEYPDFQMADAGNACGGIVSNATDMAKWLKVLLDSGRIDDNKRLFKQEMLDQLWTIVTPAGKIKQPAYLKPVSSAYWGYGFGFNMNKFRELDYVGHGGGLYGLLSKMGMIPSKKLGVFVNTNAHSGYGRDAIFYLIMDYYLGNTDFDWITAYKLREDEADKNLEQSIKKMNALRDSTIQPLLPLEKFTGTYRDKWYGDITITLKNNQLQIKSAVNPLYEGTLVHWQANTFTARWKEKHVVFSDLFATFEISPYGRVTELKLLSQPGTGRNYQDLQLLKID